jgi:hypothetical protein
MMPLPGRARTDAEADRVGQERLTSIAAEVWRMPLHTAPAHNPWALGYLRYVRC